MLDRLFVPMQLGISVVLAFRSILSRYLRYENTMDDLHTYVHLAPLLHYGSVVGSLSADVEPCTLHLSCNCAIMEMASQRFRPSFWQLLLKLWHAARCVHVSTLPNATLGEKVY